MENFAVSLVFIAVIGFFAFRMWLRHNKRVLIHRERLAAIEKGIEPPPQMEEETRRGNINIQRILLLAGLVWISLGIGTYLVLSAVYASGFRSSDFPYGLQYIGVALVCVGLSHVVVYLVGMRKDAEPSRLPRH